MALHISGVIHENLRTRNIFVKHDTDFKITSVKFIDFRHSSLSRVPALLDHRPWVEQVIHQII